MHYSQNNSIRVGQYDELASIIDQVVTHESSTLYLIPSTDASITNTVLNFVLLRKEAENVGKKIVVVTPDARVQSLAAQASLEVADSVYAQEENDERSASQKFEIRTVATHKIIRRSMADILPPDAKIREPNPIKKIKKKESVEETEESLKIKRFVPESEEDLDVEKLEEKITHKRPIVKNFVSRKHKKKSSKGFNFAALIGSPLKGLAGIFKFSGNNTSRILLLGGSVFAVAVFFFAFTQVLPRVTVTITPRVIQDTIDLDLKIDTRVSSADLEDGIIPGQVLEEVDTRDFHFTSSGEADVDERAEGFIRVFNEFSSSPQTLVANTRFLSANGELFRTTETIVVPGATIDGGKIIGSSTQVNVRASESGEQFNISPTTFSIPGFKGTEKYLAFYGKNDESMSGGFRGTTAVVTSEDLENAEEKIKQEFLTIIDQRLRNKIPENLFVLEEAFSNKIESLDFDVVALSHEENFTATVTAHARSFLFDEKDIDDAIQYHFSSSTEFGEDFDLSESLDKDYVIREINYETGFVRVSLTVEQTFSRRVDGDSLLAEILGKSEVEVRQILSNKPEIERAEVRFWPFWVKKVPSDQSDVTIQIAQ